MKQELRTDAKPTPRTVYNLYHELGPNLIKHKKLRTEWKRKIKTRLREKGWFEDFKEAVAKANETPFCTGDNDRGWKMGLDFLIRDEDGVLKILKGKYSGSKKTKFPVNPAHADGGLKKEPIVLTPEDEEILQKLIDEAALGTGTTESRR